MAKEGDQAIGSIKIKNPIELSYSENLANNALIIYVVKNLLALIYRLYTYSSLFSPSKSTSPVILSISK